MKPFLLVFVSLTTSVALAIDPPKPAPKEKGPPSEQAIAAWVRQLGDDSFAVREAAQRALIEAGPPVLAAVRQAAQSNAPEVRRRAAEVIRQIEAQIAARKPMAKAPLADSKTHYELRRQLSFKFGGLGRAKKQADPHWREFRDREDFLRQQPEWALSEAHLQYALWWKPGIAALPCLKGRQDPVAWLRDNLTAEVLPDRATLAVRWKGPDVPEAVFIVRAVADVYAEDTKDARYCERACRIENLELNIKGTEYRIAEAEKARAAGRYPEDRIPNLLENLRNEREFIRIVQVQAEALRRGENPPPLYFENRGEGPVRLNSPKDAKTDYVTVVDPPGNAIYINKQGERTDLHKLK